MKGALSVLCLLMVSMACGRSAQLPEEIYDIGIEKPDGCDISTSYDRFTHNMKCPNFNMETQKQIDETSVYTSIQVKCRYGTLPYKYLPFLKSERTKLTLENCPAPGDASFAEGWPKLTFFEFVNFNEIGPLIKENFMGMDNVTRLKLFINTRFELPHDIFSGLSKLKEIKLYVNQQTNTTIFNDLKELEKIHFSIGSNQSLANFNGVFINLPALKTLKLYYNPFTVLTKRLFEGCSNVENLDVKLNKISDIDADAFQPLTSLRNLRIEVNEVNTLTSLPGGLFSENKKLEKVEILRGALTSFIPQYYR